MFDAIMIYLIFGEVLFALMDFAHGISKRCSSLSVGMFGASFIVAIWPLILFPSVFKAFRQP
jgi:hypothetical protein